MRIILISSEFPPGPGGIGNHAYNLATNFVAKNNKVSVLTISDNAAPEEEERFDKGCNFRVVRFKRYSNKPKTILSRLATIRNEISSQQPTHIILSGLFPLLTSFFINFFAPGVKLSYVAHGGDINTSNKILQGLVNRALLGCDLVIPVSNYTKSRISAKLSPDKTRVIPNGCQINKWDVKRQDANGNHKPLELVTIGSVWPRKGQHNVLSKLAQLQIDFPEAYYHIIGLKLDDSKIRKIQDIDKLSTNYKLHGRLSDAKIKEILSNADIFCMLSEEVSSGDFEGFGIAVLEANSAGIPAIGAKGSGIEDAIKEGYNGHLINIYSTEEFISAVKKIMKNYDAYAKASVQWAADHSWSKITDKYIDALQRLN